MQFQIAESLKKSNDTEIKPAEKITKERTDAEHPRRWDENVIKRKVAGDTWKRGNCSRRGKTSCD